MHDTDNELLTATGKGTPMGELMRRYWIPALKSDEVETLGPPMRLRLLGENLVAFRSGDGSVGVMDHRCPHRLASLFFGRNEQDGLRCVYHGWQFKPDGRCVDMPSEPAESDFKNKVRADAYPTRERGGLVWVYMGPNAEPPPLPDLEANLLAEGERTLRPVMRECNWLQALEGDIDTSHFGFLHLGSVEPGQLSHVETGQVLSRRSRAKIRSATNDVGHDVRRLPSGRDRHDLLARRAVPVSFLDDAAGWTHRKTRDRACVGAAR